MEEDRSALEPDLPVGKKMKPNDYDEYDKLVLKLADTLNIAAHPDTSVTIKAAKLLIERIITSTDKFNVKKMDKQRQSSSRHAPEERDEIRIHQPKFTLNDVLLPTSVAIMNKSDESSSYDKEKDDPGETYDHAARSLKLLYLDDQKQLQLKVNEIISTIQSITANPKTDFRLKATGR